MEENKTNNYPLDKKFVIIHNFRLAVEEFKPGARLSEKLNMSIGANTEVLIITNFGQISGKLVDPNDQKFEDLGQAFFDTIIKNSAKVINKLDRQNVFNNCELLLIKDAVVTPFSSPNVRIVYKYLTLFTDQVVGISIGEIAE